MHITIAGNLGSGKSTVCKYLEKNYGFDVYSTGAIQRKLAQQLSVDTLQLNNIMSQDLKYDHMIDNATAKLAEEQITPPIVFDSRMAWKFASNSFKIFMIVDPFVAATRVIEGRRDAVEQYSSVQEAQTKLLERSLVENERFKRMYQVDNFDYRNYNLIIDTTYSTPETVGAIIYAKYMDYCKNPTNETEILLSPKMLFPMQRFRNINSHMIEKYVESRDYESNPAAIISFEGYHYIVDGHHRMLAALLNKEAFVSVKLADSEQYPFFKDSDHLISEIENMRPSDVYDYENAGDFRFASYPKYYRMG